jgi:VWFA-related protein
MKSPIILGFLLSSLACVSQVAGPPATAVVPAQRQVTIFVSAVDRAGNPLQSLVRDQVSVLDNNQPATVLEVRNATELPLHLGIVLLCSKTHFAQEQKAAIDLARKVLRPNVDKAFVLAAGGGNGGTSHLEWLPDSDRAEAAIQALDKDFGLPDPFNFDLSNYAVANSRMNIQQIASGGPNVFDFIWKFMDTDLRPARRAVVLFRNPWGHSPGLDMRFHEIIEARHKKIIADAQEIWAALYIIGVEERVTPPPADLGRTYAPTLTGQGGRERVYDQEIDKLRNRQYNAGRNNVERLAEETGGGVWLNPKKDFSDAVGGIANRLKGSYALAYSVPQNGGEAAHSLQVRAIHQDAHIATQKEYFSPQ